MYILMGIKLRFTVLVIYIALFYPSQVGVMKQRVSTVRADYIYGKTQTAYGKNMYTGSPSAFS
jgi:hypothetical protein